MSKGKTTYKEALERIEEIVEIVENENPDVDELAQLVKEGASLISLCQEKLRNAEGELTKSLETLEQNSK